MSDMTSAPPDIAFRRRAVRAWLWAVAALIFATLVVGGATRLTESGLSIVEWKPLTGVVPPLNEAAWQAEFDKYKLIPQFRELFPTMTLAQFETIYWWEWSHRLLARLVGAAFLLPFVWFLWRGWIEPGLRVRLWGIFGLGAALGAVGWWMVASGLSERVNVSQYRLAFHLTLACVVFTAIVWTAQRLAPRPEIAAPPRVRRAAVLLVFLTLFQIYLGALVAGLRAGLIYNTWPLIDGSFIPDGNRLLFDAPWWRNLFENTLTVQFNHRMAAYVLVLVALLHAIDAATRARQALAGAAVLAGLLVLQMALGVLTLIHQVPIGLGLAHQALAMVALTAAIMHAARLARPAAAISPAQRPMERPT
jgi:cytochrome c oxidase assembly protein subunit 15